MKLNIRRKLTLIGLITSFFTIVLLGVFGYLVGRSILQEAVFKQLTSVKASKKNQIENYFSSIDNQVKTLSGNHMIIDAVEDFTYAFDFLDNYNSDMATSLDNFYSSEISSKLSENNIVNINPNDLKPSNEKAVILQFQYLVNNEFPIGEKHKLIKDKSGSNYAQIHETYHNYFSEVISDFGFYDFFIIDNKGNIVYTVFKETDFATNLINGPYRNSSLAKEFSAIKKLNPGETRIIDYELYLPSYNAPAAFVAAPVYNALKDSCIGVIAVQAPVDKINAIMTGNRNWNEDGLGYTGETYLVGKDYLMRSDSRFLIQDPDGYYSSLKEQQLESIAKNIKTYNTSILFQKVKTEATINAFKGKSGTHIISDYRDVPVLSSYSPLNIKGIEWAIISEIDLEEANIPINSFLKGILLIAIVLIVLLFVFAPIIAKRISKPINKLTKFSREFSEMDFNNAEDFALSENLGVIANRSDEIGELAVAFDNMKNDLISSIEEIKEAEREKANFIEKLRASNEGLEAAQKVNEQLIQELKVNNDLLEEKVKERTKDLEKAFVKIEMIINNSADIIITINEEHKIVQFNKSAEKTFGYDSNEIFGKDLKLLLPELSKPVHKDLVDGFKNSENTAQQMGERKSISGVKKDGTEFPVEATISKNEVDGKMFFTAFARDITVRKQMEEELSKAFDIISKQKDRMEKELLVGHQIQMSMLPLIFPAFPEHKEFTVYATLKPAREVGGDFYDFFFIDETRFCFIIGDVSGKGVPSALFMAVTKTLIKSKATIDFSTASIITQVNDELSKDNNSYMFVTVFIVIIDLKTGELTFTNAGHNPPYILRKDGEVVLLKQFHGPVLGAKEGIAYKEGKAKLSKSDKILLFTDGVTEAKNRENKLFSDQRFFNYLNDNYYMSSENLVKDIMNEVEVFEDGALQTDDVTLLALEYFETTDITTKTEKLTIKNEMSEITKVVKTFNHFAEINNLEKGLRRKMNMVFDELLNNVISYGYGDKKVHEIDIEINLTNERLSVIIIDDGIPFNPFDAEEPDVSLSVQNREVGGLGIHLVKKTMDKIIYERKINKNKVLLIKNI